MRCSDAVWLARGRKSGGFIGRKQTRAVQAFKVRPEIDGLGLIKASV